LDIKVSGLASSRENPNSNFPQGKRMIMLALSILLIFSRNMPDGRGKAYFTA
jgi:hypothetical protein